MRSPSNLERYVEFIKRFIFEVSFEAEFLLGYFDLFLQLALEQTLHTSGAFEVGGDLP